MNDFNNELSRVFKIYKSSSSLYGRKPKKVKMKIIERDLENLIKMRPQYEDFYFCRDEFNAELAKEYRIQLKNN